MHFIQHISTFISLRISYNLYFSSQSLSFHFKLPSPTHILHQDLLTESPLNGEELTPQSRSMSPFPIHTQHPSKW